MSLGKKGIINSKEMSRSRHVQMGKNFTIKRHDNLTICSELFSKTMACIFVNLGLVQISLSNELALKKFKVTGTNNKRR